VTDLLRRIEVQFSERSWQVAVLGGIVRRMTKASSTAAVQDSLRRAAMKLTDIEEGIACAGTSLEKRTLKVRGMAFLFLGPSDFMLKLGESLAEASALAESHPGSIKAGAGGWVTVKFGPDLPKLPAKLLERWVRESYHLFAAKKSARKK